MDQHRRQDQLQAKSFHLHQSQIIERIHRLRLTVSLLGVFIFGLIFVTAEAQAKAETSVECGNWMNYQFNKLNSTESVHLCEQFAGQVLVVVNTASQCGFTPQFEQLEAVYQAYKDRGLSVIGFPSNDFNQDRGSVENTAKVCYLDYGVTFPMMERTHVKGVNANPVFQDLSNQSGITPKWNFYKYIIDRKGAVVAVFSSQTNPTDSVMVDAIEKAL